MDAEAHLLTGRRLGGRYLVGARIGAGGMGAVYEAVQEDLRRRVAVKVLREDLAAAPAVVERFRREALAAAGLGHPHIVQVTDFHAATAADPAFLVMELLAGRSLHAAVRESFPPRIAPERLARIALQVLGALDAAHAAGIIHRDIKPDNVFLCDTDIGADLVKVLDFGIAKLHDDEMEEALPLTRAGTVLGTPSFMAPEQARGDRDVDARADIYGVGGCLFFAAAGRPPILVDGSRDFRVIAAAPTTPLGEIRADLDPAFCRIVDRALKKSRDVRFGSAAAMREALETWLKGEPVPELPPTVPTLREGEPLIAADARETPRLVTETSRRAPVQAPPAAQEPRETTLAAASSTMASPGTGKPSPTPPRRGRPVGIVLAAAGLLAAVVLGPRLLAGSESPRPADVERPLRTEPSVAPTPLVSVVVSAPAVPVPVPPTPSVLASAPARVAASAIASGAKGFGAFDERGVGASLVQTAEAAKLACSRLAGPRTQTFLVRFGHTGEVVQVTPTSHEALSPSQTCIEQQLRGVHILPWVGSSTGVTAASVTLQPLPGNGAFD